MLISSIKHYFRCWYVSLTLPSFEWVLKYILNIYKKSKTVDFASSRGALANGELGITLVRNEEQQLKPFGKKSVRDIQYVW